MHKIETGFIDLSDAVFAMPVLVPKRKAARHNAGRKKKAVSSNENPQHPLPQPRHPTLLCAVAMATPPSPQLGPIQVVKPILRQVTTC